MDQHSKAGRISALDMMLRHMTSKPNVWFARRREIAEHWLKRFGKYQ